MKLGAEAFQELLRGVPDWTSFIVNRALEGKDVNRTPDRMAALRELAEFLAFLPSTVERRELFASLAHQLRIPLPELERAVKARVPGQDTQVLIAEEIPRIEVDDLLRPVLRLCWNASFRVRLDQVPHAWWESLQGAPLLQAVLDADGSPDHMPAEVLAHFRRLEASWASKDDAELEPEQILLRLEVAYVEREKQSVSRQLQEPGVMADPLTLRRLEVKAAELLVRAKHLRKQLVGQRQRG